MEISRWVSRNLGTDLLVVEHRRRRAAIGRLVLVLGVAGCVLVACSCSSHRVSCTEANRRTVLAVTLKPQLPSAHIDVAKGHPVGVRLTRNPPNASGPLGNIGPIANVYFIRVGHDPNLLKSNDGLLYSNDPTARISKVSQWVDIRLPAGSWSAYSIDDELTIDVSTCGG